MSRRHIVFTGDVTHDEAREILTWLATQGVQLPTGYIEISVGCDDIDIAAAIPRSDPLPDAITRNWRLT